MKRDSRDDLYAAPAYGCPPVLNKDNPDREVSFVLVSVPDRWAPGWIPSIVELRHQFGLGLTEVMDIVYNTPCTVAVGRYSTLEGKAECVRASGCEVILEDLV